MHRGDLIEGIKREIWFGVIPDFENTSATGSRYPMNRGRSAVIFMAK